MRSPEDMDIIQIVVCTSCHLRCSNCHHGVSHQAEPFIMPLDKFEKAVDSLLPWLRPGKVIGLIGGEPLSHPRFGDLCEILRKRTGRPKLNNGLHPIGDFNAFVNERLHDRSNGLGLWTALGPHFREHYEQVMQTFSHWNVNTHEHEGRHQAMFIERSEFCRIYGLTDAEWEANRWRCWVQESWSASITPHGSYACECMGTIDNLYYQGKHAWPVTPDWWKRQPEDFKDQLHLCNHCALAQPGPSSIASEDTDVLCELSVARLATANSPAVRKGKYEVVK